METTWKPEEHKVRVCLLFDETNFPVGDPSSTHLVSAATLGGYRRDIDLSKCVVDSVDVLSTEIKIANDDRPLFFFLKLESADKPLEHTTLCGKGHPVGDGCGAKNYYERTKRESEDRLALEFGAFLPFDDDMLNTLAESNELSQSFFKKIGNLMPNKREVSVTERGFRRFRAEEKEDEMEAWQGPTGIRSKVESLFHNMTSVKAKLSVAGNESTQITEDTSPLLARVVLEIRLRATKNMLN